MTNWYMIYQSVIYLSVNLLFLLQRVTNLLYQHLTVSGCSEEAWELFENTLWLHAHKTFNHKLLI